MNNIMKKVELVENQAKDYGFYWPNSDAVMQQILSECKEVEELLNKTNSTELQEEIGDLLHAVISLCIYCGYDTKTTLEQALNKFEKRFNMTKVFAQKAGYQNMHGQNMDKMMKYWDMAKRSVG
ncbi:MAG: nucleotide pyrophosphohydrolase [Rickettsiales bacterium]|nr:nucleotide pyrophosphohydrolase [Rickettsiales bacterium]